MREIKFRAWDESEETMFFPETKDSHNAGLLMNLYGDLISSHRTQKNLGSSDGYDYALLWARTGHTFNLMQFTGLKDKNGTDIYEGDIVAYKTAYYGNEKNHKKEVKWEEWKSDDFGMPNCSGYFNLDSSFEVIGNIYENKELLEDKDAHIS